MGVLGKRNRSLRSRDATARLLGRRLLAVENRGGGPSFIAQCHDALEFSLGMDKGGRGGADFRFRLFALKTKVRLVERRERLARLDAVSDIHRARRDFSRYAEAKVTLDARLDRGDEAALGALWLEFRSGDEDRSGNVRLLGRRLLASGEQSEESADNEQAKHGVAFRRSPGRHRILPRGETGTHT